METFSGIHFWKDESRMSGVFPMASRIVPQAAIFSAPFLNFLKDGAASSLNFLREGAAAPAGF
jgi:hypothetical protein